MKYKINSVSSTTSINLGNGSRLNFVDGICEVPEHLLDTVFPTESLEGLESRGVISKIEEKKEKKEEKKEEKNNLLVNNEKKDLSKKTSKK